MEICGKVDEESSHFTCNTGLKFLCSLMNHEKNPGICKKFYIEQ